MSQAAKAIKGVSNVAVSTRKRVVDEIKVPSPLNLDPSILEFLEVRGVLRRGDSVMLIVELRRKAEYLDRVRKQQQLQQQQAAPPPPTLSFNAIPVSVPALASSSSAASGVSTAPLGMYIDISQWRL